MIDNNLRTSGEHATGDQGSEVADTREVARILRFYSIEPYADACNETVRVKAVLLKTAAEEIERLLGESEHVKAFWRSVWQPIETAPKAQMFIWAAPKDGGKWGLGLAYRNVSGGWSDAYGSDAPEHATHWMPLPSPPGEAR